MRLRRPVSVATALGLLGVVTAVVATAAPGHSEPSSPAVRLLYSGDWSGRREIYAVDAAHPGRVSQITFGAPSGCESSYPCGFDRPQPSPDGTRLLFWPDLESGRCTDGFFVARADGRARRRVGRAVCWTRTALWAPDSRRIAYVGRNGVHTVRADGSGDRLVRRGSSAGGLAWSRDGRVLAFHLDGEVFVVRAGVARSVAASSAFSLSPSGRLIAYVDAEYRVRLVAADGSGDRVLGDGYAPSWSTDGRFLAWSGRRGIVVLEPATGGSKTLGREGAREPTWAPRGARLAFVDGDHVVVAEVRTGATRLLDSGPGPSQLAWAPSGGSLAYLSGGPAYPWARGDVRVATLGAPVRIVVDADGPFGGRLDGIAWTRPPRTARYRSPSARSVAAVTAAGLVAPWPISALAADGDRVAYVSCGHVFAWTPATRTVVQADAVASAAPWCSVPPDYSSSFRVYSVALAGDRVAYAWVVGNTGRTWAVAGRVLGAGRPPFLLETRYGVAGGIGGAYGLADLVGSDGLLVYTRWRETSPSPGAGIATTQQTIVRADGESCPCADIASAGGPLVPFDVDGDRIAAGRKGALQVLDGGGSELLSVSVDAVAAALSGRDLVALVSGGLRHYDAATGELLHSWPLPAVPAGFRCGTPSGNRCGEPPRLVLDDAARGLAAYALDGQVHLLRLADGADRVVGAGSFARFMSSGLVYADGANLRLVPFEALPLWAF